MDLIEARIHRNRHPWELSRTKCVLSILRKYILNTVVDIGAGDRFFISKLRPFISGEAYAIDVGYNKSEVIEGIHCLNNTLDIPKLNGGGAVVMMDVLEHIENDKSFLNEILKKVSKDDLIFVTVPAFQQLFSNHDVFLKHYRRYNKQQLLDLVRSCNLNVERCHYFYASLFFARWAGLLLKKEKSVDKEVGIGGWNFSDKHIITRIIYAILNIDFCICSFFAKFNIYLPGLSLLAICKLSVKEAQ
ncbi:hypothetical protein R83H12_02455 [Fibrobacteria bacterium R8-3-H12]